MFANATEYTLPSYPVIAAATGFSKAEWSARSGLVQDLMGYDPSDGGAFGGLLRRSMDIIPGQADLASLIGVSVPTLHRWAAGTTKADSALTPIQRATLAGLLSMILIHGIATTRVAMPGVLRHLKAAIAGSFMTPATVVNTFVGGKDMAVPKKAKRHKKLSRGGTTTKGRARHAAALSRAASMRIVKRNVGQKLAGRGAPRRVRASVQP